jgi:hypothetical protein
LIKKSIFFPDPKSHTQMGSLRAKNASEKFSRLGTFKVGWKGEFSAEKPTFQCRKASMQAYILSLRIRAQKESELHSPRKPNEIQIDES